MKPPKAPSHLSPVAKETWTRLLLDGALLELFALTDMFAFEILCENYAAWISAKESKTIAEREAAKHVAKNLRQGKEQRAKLFQLNVAVRTAEAGLRNWLEACGMTPPMRSKVEPTESDDHEEMIDLSKATPAERKALRKVARDRTAA